MEQMDEKIEDIQNEQIAAMFAQERDKERRRAAGELPITVCNGRIINAVGKSLIAEATTPEPRGHG
jgi:hypothetical protein